MRKITSEEIENLYDFTRKHYVEFYDVQTELVDHLASAMDEAWEEAPELSFDDNLQREFKRFGVFGFMDVVEKKAAALEKRYFKLIWREMKLKAGNPAVILSITGIFSGILFTIKTGIPALMISVFLIYCGLVIYFMVKPSRELKRKKKTNQRIYLLEHYFLTTGGYFSLSYLPFHFYNFSDPGYSPLWVQLLIAFLFSFIIFSGYICFYALPKKRDQILKEQYPELKF